MSTNGEVEDVVLERPEEPASLAIIQSLCLTVVTKIAVLEARAAKLDDLTVSHDRLTKTVLDLSSETMKLYARLTPIGRFHQTVAVIAGSAVGGAVVALAVWFAGR